MRTQNKIVFLIAFFALIFNFNTKALTTSLSTADSTNYRLVISFFSRASGIDREAKKEVDALIDQTQQKLEAKKKDFMIKEETRWGREGEIDYCMNMNSLTKKEKKTFINKIKSIAKRSGQITILENSPCIHRR